MRATYLTVSNGVSRILDGVINFRIRSFDLSGWVLTNNPAYDSYPDAWTNFPALVKANVILQPDYYPPSGEIGIYWFFSNAVPASVEVELGMLEQRAYEQYKSLPTDVARYRYLTNQLVGVVGKVHLFRQRIPVRNVDPSAYR